MEQQMILSIVDMTETAPRGREAQARFEGALEAVTTFGDRLGTLEAQMKVNSHDVLPRIRDYVAGMAVFVSFDTDDLERLRNAGAVAADNAKLAVEALRQAEAC